MSILLIGGTGKTGLRLARLLQNANQPFLLASRGCKPIPEPFQGVKFHWDDPTTHEKLFSAHADIDRVYIIGPEAVPDVSSIMKPFIELAITKGVKRFVMLTATTTPTGSSGMEDMHKYLANRGVEYCILRPTWFIENFGEFRLSGILNDNTIMTATEDGRIPFVSADDIADVAFRALTDKESHNTEHLIVGPELYSHDEAVKMLSEVIGRKITHTRMSHDEAVVFWRQFVPTEFAEAMVEIEDAVARGDEEACFHARSKQVGKRRLRPYFEANRELWSGKSYIVLNSVLTDIALSEASTSFRDFVKIVAVDFSHNHQRFSVTMGVCTTSSLFSGFMICNPKLRSLATAVHNFRKKERNETPIQEAPGREVDKEEISGLSYAVDYWLKKSNRPFRVYSNNEENDEDVEPAIVLCYSDGESKLTKWGRENYGSKYDVVEELWGDEEFLRKAKEAFKQLGEDPVMKEAHIVPKMEWIQGLSVG